MINFQGYARFAWVGRVDLLVVAELFPAAVAVPDGTDGDAGDGLVHRMDDLLVALIGAVTGMCQLGQHSLLADAVERLGYVEPTTDRGGGVGHW